MNTQSNSTPSRFGKYQVIEKLATGTMGVVYEGYDPVAERPVAIKVSLSEHIKDKKQARRYNDLFAKEAKTGRLLHHQNIMEVFDYGVDQGRHYMVMELVKHARTLKDYISDEELLKPEEALDFIIQCAEGLDYSHKNGVIHRDIKPANILVTEDKVVKLADFSIAFVKQDDFDMTMSTGFVGSPRYMSPEQVQEDLITNQTDLYSLGVVMYELLTGKHPFNAESFSRLIYMVVNEEPPSPLVYKPDLPKKLAQYMLRALTKDPKKRFASASDMVKHLRHVYPRRSKNVEFQKEESVQQDFSKLEEKIANQMKNMAIFSKLKESELYELSKESSVLSLVKNDKIIISNDNSSALYILLAGEISNRKVKVGDCFGEAAFLSQESQFEVIVALSEAKLLEIERSSLEQLSIESQLSIYKKIAVTMANKLSAVNS